MASPPGSTRHTLSQLLLLMASGFWGKPPTPSSCVSAAADPHQPIQQTWQVLSGTSEVVWETTSDLYPPWTWWPSLYPDLCQLAAGLGNWDIPITDPNNPDVCQPYTNSITQSTCACPADGMGSESYGCSHPEFRDALRNIPFYVCPRDGRARDSARNCGGIDSYYCKAWGCETTGTTWWEPTSSWDWIRVTKVRSQGLSGSKCYRVRAIGIDKGPTLGAQTPRGGQWTGTGPCVNFTCNLLNISFTPSGRREDDSWRRGRQWGLRLYISNWDNGLTFKVRLLLGKTKQHYQQLPSIDPGSEETTSHL